MRIPITPEVHQAAIELIGAGFSIVPMSIGDNSETKKTDKLPCIKNWIPLRTRPLTAKDFEDLLNTGKTETGIELQIRQHGINAIAIIPGAISGCLEALDIDLKNDTPDEAGNDLWNKLSISIAYDEILGGIYKELIIERSRSGGYHIMYRTPELLPGKIHLAKTEKEDELIAVHGHESVLIIVAPSEGYTPIKNALTDEIPILTHEQRDRLFEICRELDRSGKYKGYTDTAPIQTYIADAFTPEGERAYEADEYNHRTTPEALSSLLVAHGWTKGTTDQKGVIKMLRPGDSTNGHSAYISPPGTPYEKGTKRTSITMFSVFSHSAAPFEVAKNDGNKRAYTPFDVYKLLEHGGNYPQASAALKGEGYGAQTFKNVPQELGREVVITDNENALLALRKLGYKVVQTQGPINQRQAEDLTAKGVKNFILCLEDVTDVYASFAPIIAARGTAYLAQAATPQAIDTAKPYYRYFLDDLQGKYPLDGPKADQNQNLVSEEVVRFAGKIDDPTDRDRLLSEALSVLSPFGITKASLEEVARNIRKNRIEKENAEKIARGIEEVKNKLEKGGPGAALEKMEALNRSIRAHAQEANVDSLLEIDSEDSIREVLERRTEDIETGYRIRYDDGDVNGAGTYRKPEELRLPSAALTIIAARTSHRKTGLMLNMALNIAGGSREKVPGDVYFLTYEEESADLYVKLLNIYIDADLDGNNLDYIRSFYRKGHTSRENRAFMEGREKFFGSLVKTGRLRVKGLDGTYTSESLSAAVDNLMRAAKPAPSVIFIDYIQLIGTDRDIENKQLKLQQICTELRELAKRAAIPIVLGAQFNRLVAQEGDLDSSKIREAGDIEQEANLVLGLWDRAFTREGKTENAKNGTQKTTGGHLDRNGNPAKKEPGVLYVEVLKGRNIGVGGYAELTYNPKTGRIKHKEQENTGVGQSNPLEMMKRIRG